MNIKHIISISIITCSIYVGSVFGFQQQGFTTFTEGIGGINASCSSQCALLVEKLGGSDILSLSGTILGQGQISRGFLVSGQVYVVGNQQISATSSVSITAPLKNNQIYDQLQGDPDVIVVLQGNMQLKDVALSLTMQTIGEKISAGIKSSSKYEPYSPRTINFLEAPIWNGQYITQSFFYRLFFLVLICIVIFYSADKKNKKNVLLTGGIIIVFFWVIVDIFAFMQQTNLYKQIVNSNPLLQTRYGAQLAEIQYLDYIKQIIPAGSNVFIYATYPYDFELQYRLYPYVRIGTTGNSSYILRYNPYGPSNPFNYVNPIVGDTTVQVGGEIYPLIKNNIYGPQGGVLQIK